MGGSLTTVLIVGAIFIVVLLVLFYVVDLITHSKHKSKSKKEKKEKKHKEEEKSEEEVVTIINDYQKEESEKQSLANDLAKLMAQNSEETKDKETASSCRNPRCAMTFDRIKKYRQSRNYVEYGDSEVDRGDGESLSGNADDKNIDEYRKIVPFMPRKYGDE